MTRSPIFRPSGDARAVGDRPAVHTILMSSGVAIAMGLTLLAGLAEPAFPQALSTDVPETTAPDVALSQGQMPQSFADLAERLSPAVVNITTSTTLAQVDRGPQGILPDGMLPEGSPFEDFFRDFLDRQPGNEGAPDAPQRRPRQSNALGSGFIISADGYIVTNNHVIEQADEIKIELYSGGVLDAELVGRDPKTDIALLKVESDAPLPFVSFGDSNASRVGDWVLAIGNPLGQGF